MSREELVEIVAAMRKAQKDYFRDPNFSRLGVARDWERRCDQALAGIRSGPSLFDPRGDANEPG